MGFGDDGPEWAAFPPPPPPSACSGPTFYCETGTAGAHLDVAAFPSLPVLAVCSSVVLVAMLVAAFLLWRHKSKVQNLLPCKSDPPASANGVTYEDVLVHHHPTRLPQGNLPLQLLDVKLGDAPPPVYEEVTRAPTSDEDEYPSREGSATSSVRGSTGGDLSRDPVSSDGEECDDFGRQQRWHESQENIYSTIDEDELPVTSLARKQRHHAPDAGSSYGDILPAFRPAPFT